MKLNIQLTEEPFALKAVNEEGISLHMDAAPGIGGQGKGMRPMEVLASSLAGCMAIDVLLILRKQRQTVTHFAIEVDGKRRDGIPASFEALQLTFTVNKEVDENKLDTAIRLTHEKYCSVSQSLHPDIIFTHKITRI